MELDPGEISLMSAGACGAFVHGLEDEFMGELLCARREDEHGMWHRSFVYVHVTCISSMLTMDRAYSTPTCSSNSRVTTSSLRVI